MLAAREVDVDQGMIDPGQAREQLDPVAVPRQPVAMDADGVLHDSDLLGGWSLHCIVPGMKNNRRCWRITFT